MVEDAVVGEHRREAASVSLKSSAKSEQIPSLLTPMPLCHAHKITTRGQ